ncbi:MAG: hypothetical protein ACREKN_04370 [Longimicrobiaceae bacterium]
MRRFQARDGALWDVTVGRESWGKLLLLFAPRAGGGVRQSVLPHQTVLAAERALAGMSGEELREHLDRALPWSG